MLLRASSVWRTGFGVGLVDLEVGRRDVVCILGLWCFCLAKVLLSFMLIWLSVVSSCCCFCGCVCRCLVSTRFGWGVWVWFIVCGLL